MPAAEARNGATAAAAAAVQRLRPNSRVLQYTESGQSASSRYNDHRKAGVGVDDCPDRPRDHGGQALVVQELGRAEPEAREPAREGQVALADAGRREPHHLLVQGAVVEIRHRPQLGAELPQTPDDGDGHDDPGPEPGPGRRGLGARLLRFGEGRHLRGGRHDRTRYAVSAWARARAVSSWKADVTNRAASVTLRMFPHSMSTFGSVARFSPARSSRGCKPFVPS